MRILLPSITENRIELRNVSDDLLNDFQEPLKINYSFTTIANLIFMKKVMKIIWKVIAALSGLAVLISIIALTQDKSAENLANDWMIIGSGLTGLLFAFTFIALLSDDK